MKCPLYFIGRTAVIPKEGAEIGDCLQEKCAWWDKPCARCLFLTIAMELGSVTYFLKEMREKMPHEEQFRR